MIFSKITILETIICNNLVTNFIFHVIMNFQWTYCNLWDYQERKIVQLIIDEKSWKHIQDRHGCRSDSNGSKFQDDTEMYNFLNSWFHLEQKQWNEYRWWDLENKYNITAKKISEWVFEIITIFPKKNK